MDPSRGLAGFLERLACPRLQGFLKTATAFVRYDKPHNECKRAVYSDLTTLMGRAACHTGQEVTWDQMMQSDFQFCDYLDDLSPESPAPVKADENGQFPVPVPGRWTEF